MATKQDDYIKTALRLPRDLHAKILEAAEKSGRSMNAEIVARLEDSFEYRTNGRFTWEEVVNAIQESAKAKGDDVEVQIVKKEPYVASPALTKDQNRMMELLRLKVIPEPGTSMPESTNEVINLLRRQIAQLEIEMEEAQKRKERAEKAKQVAEQEEKTKAQRNAKQNEEMPAQSKQRRLNLGRNKPEK